MDFNHDRITTILIESSAQNIAGSRHRRWYPGHLCPRPGLLIENRVYSITRVIANRSNTAWMFISLLTTNWAPTQVMPRWLALVSYALTLALLISFRLTHLVSMIFPACVILISTHILILNYRQQEEITIKDGLTLDD